MFIVLLDWLRPGGRGSSWIVAAGLILGFCGASLLLAPWSSPGIPAFSWLGAAAVLLASAAWAAGSLYALQAEQPTSPFVSTGMHMFSGGVWLLLAGLLTGEWGSISLAHVSLRSWIAVMYLLIFGSLIAFTAYVWLLRKTTPARASTHAYVNPVVAVLLGWLLADEAVTARMLLAMGVIIAGVVLINSRQSERSAQTSRHPESRQAVLEDGLCASE
jgi:drug/metabolite transporter (DMT)-like permease